jgi:hypothetical protein
MQGQVTDGPVLLLRISEEDYAMILELFAFVPRMDRAIIGYEQPVIDRLAARLAAAPFSPAREKEVRLTGSHLSCLMSVFAAAHGPLGDRRDVQECLQKMMDWSEHLSYFVNWESAAKDGIH